LRRATTQEGFAGYAGNCVGGNIAGGSACFPQLFFCPIFRMVPYATPDRSLFICSSSTPPGPGVHGMCGHLAARVALDRAFR